MICLMSGTWHSSALSLTEQQWVASNSLETRSPQRVLMLWRKLVKRIRYRKKKRDLFFNKHHLPIMSSLNHMMGKVRQNDTNNARHCQLV